MYGLKLLKIDLREGPRGRIPQSFHPDDEPRYIDRVEEDVVAMSFIA